MSWKAVPHYLNAIDYFNNDGNTSLWRRHAVSWLPDEASLNEVNKRRLRSARLESGRQVPGGGGSAVLAPP